MAQLRLELLLLTNDFSSISGPAMSLGVHAVAARRVRKSSTSDAGVRRFGEVIGAHRFGSETDRPLLTGFRVATRAGDWF
jgi:hypothetical protein